MKGILVIIDGMGDLPNRILGGKTPLEIANTPNLDFLATRGELGRMDTVKPGFIPGSDEAIVSIFGNDLMDNSRGVFEALGSGIKLTRGDLSFRVNFATIDNIHDKNIIDRRCGRTLTTEEADVLSKSLSKKINIPCKFQFEHSVQHRGSLVFFGGFSDNISRNDVSYYNQGSLKVRNKAELIKPLDDEENSQYTANIVNEFLSQAFEILNNHPVNENRRKKGLMPANYLLLRGPGVEIPKLNLYKGWMAITYMPLEIGIAKVSGMTPFTFEYPEMENLDAYDNLYEGLVRACKFSVKTLKQNYKKFDYAWIHIKEPDLPGHDNKPFEKKMMFEYIDKNLFSFIRKFATKNKVRVAVTADHSTPCEKKSHSADPVPILLYNGEIPREKHFNEREAKMGTLGRIQGKEFINKIKFNL
jgi:2,3-bisphosphoglycerate-independent phosphoglycerate mutase